MKRVWLPAAAISLTFVGLQASLGAAIIAPLTISSRDVSPPPQWLYGQAPSPQGNSSAALMAAAAKAKFDGQFDLCLSKLGAVWARAKNLQPWLMATELECATRLKTPNADRLQRVLAKARRHQPWFFKGPQARSLRDNYIDAALSAIETDMKRNRARAASTGEELMDFLPYADNKQRARLWRLMGELMFLNQKNEAARELLTRSLGEVESDEARAKLIMVEKALGLDKLDFGTKTDPSRGVQSTDAVGPVEAADEEQRLVAQVTGALKTGDLVSAVSDAVQIIREFPGSTRAKWAADRVFDAYNTIAEKNDPKLARTRAQMIKEMLKVDADRLSEWARGLYSKGQWEDALTLSRQALATLTGSRATAVLDLAAKCAVATDNFDLALELSRRLIRQHSGTAASREALLRSALAHFRMAKFAQATTDLERLLALPEVGQLEVTARYWLWRSLQKQKSPRAEQIAGELMQKFAFSYYGLRARMERQGSALEWKESPQPASTKFWLTVQEKQALERARALVKSGWLEEAQIELKELPTPHEAEEKAIWSLLWASAGNYVNASRLANEAWDEKSEFRRPPFVGASFPLVFTRDIEQHATARKLDRDLVRSLIKQESGFNVRASSPANALGLMQLMAPTAKEVARDLRLGPIEIPDDLFKAPRNIQLGTYYLSRMISRYQGHVPLALAAYNAGPTRLDRWLKMRSSLQTLMQNQTSRPEDELWFDEMPYSETSIYVKSILRNLLMYKILDVGRVQVPDPIWALGKSEK